MSKQSFSLIFFAFACLLCITMSTETREATNEEKQVNDRKWCIVKPSSTDVQLYANIEYCCNQGVVNCSVIQYGGLCYNPTNKVSNASVVMNLYYQAVGKPQHACYFKGSGLIIYDDPSVGDCIYPSL